MKNIPIQCPGCAGVTVLHDIDCPNAVAPELPDGAVVAIGADGTRYTKGGAKPQRLIIDHIIIVCKGCHRERTVYPDRTLIGAEAFIQWTKIDLGNHRCPCGATHCDIKAHLKP
jgi:hypothetical protein